MAKQARVPRDPDLLARLWNDLVLGWRLLFDGRVSGTAKLIPLAMVVYILSPIDLVPDVFLPFGVVDDLSALLIGLQLFIRSAPPGVVSDYRGRAERRRRAIHTPPNADAPVIEGQYEVRDDE